jgi:hypothetical protein
MIEAEVGHGAGYGADVERVARGDEDYFYARGVYAFALGWSEQELIVECW